MENIRQNEIIDSDGKEEILEIKSGKKDLKNTNKGVIKERDTLKKKVNKMISNEKANKINVYKGMPRTGDTAFRSLFIGLILFVYGIYYRIRKEIYIL